MSAWLTHAVRRIRSQFAAREPRWSGYSYSEAGASASARDPRPRGVCARSAGVITPRASPPGGQKARRACTWRAFDSSGLPLLLQELAQRSDLGGVYRQLALRTSDVDVVLGIAQRLLGETLGLGGLGLV